MQRLSSFRGAARKYKSTHPRPGRTGDIRQGIVELDLDLTSSVITTSIREYQEKEF